MQTSDRPTAAPIRIVLAQPRGFCAGVERAIDIVERALGKYGPPVYVRHEIVHNRHVVEDLRAKGAVFVDALDAVPEGAIPDCCGYVRERRGVSERRERERFGIGRADAVQGAREYVRIDQGQRGVQKKTSQSRRGSGPPTA